MTTVRKILISGSYDANAEVPEQGTQFVNCARDDATHVSVYLVDKYGDAEPVHDYPCGAGKDMASAYAHT